MIMTFSFDAPRDAFTIPFLNHPIAWYGILFAFGFTMGYCVVRKLFACHLEAQGFELKDAKLKAVALTDRLTLLVVVATILGARLGHVFFYEWDYYSKNPGLIVKVWEGGLASHGGALGIFLALLLFSRWSVKFHPTLNFLATLDVIAIPAAIVAGCIRIGNFINQEILGAPTSLPWGVIFCHPLEKVGQIPLHPVQLYEAFIYFLIFTFLLMLWKKDGKVLGSGVLAGWFFVLVFGARFLIEYIKLPQTAFDNSFPLKMGQILSIPFVVIGVVLLLYSRKKTKK